MAGSLKINKMKKKILAFDLDGTLIDTTGMTFRRINKVLNELELPSLPDTVLRKYWGKKVKKFFHFICKQAGANRKQRKAFSNRDLEIISNFKFEISEDLLLSLKILKKNGILLALITNRSLNGLKKMARESDVDLKQVRKLFDFVQTGNCYKHKKPDGRVFRPLLKWIQAQGLSVSDLVYIGDTIEYDLKAAQESKPKIDFVAVLSGLHEAEDFYKLGLKEDEIVRSFADLPFYILKIADMEMKGK